VVTSLLSVVRGKLKIVYKKCVLVYCRSPHSGSVDTDTGGMLHVGEPSVHDDAVTADDGVQASALVVNNPPPTACDTPIMPPSVATQSAVYQQPGEDGRPVYRGFQDPKSQSQTFKKLQNLIESGEGKTVAANKPQLNSELR